LRRLWQLPLGALLLRLLLLRGRRPAAAGPQLQLLHRGPVVLVQLHVVCLGGPRGRLLGLLLGLLGLEQLGLLPLLLLLLLLGLVAQLVALVVVELLILVRALCCGQLRLPVWHVLSSESWPLLLLLLLLPLLRGVSCVLLDGRHWRWACLG
jgi:hypothetical protein